MVTTTLPQSQLEAAVRLATPDQFLQLLEHMRTDGALTIKRRLLYQVMQRLIMETIVQAGQRSLPATQQPVALVRTRHLQQG
jgi:hypothetical protein